MKTEWKMAGQGHIVEHHDGSVKPTSTICKMDFTDPLPKVFKRAAIICMLPTYLDFIIKVLEDHKSGRLQLPKDYEPLVTKLAQLDSSAIDR